MPYEAIDKPCPSGGGIHDLELYLIVSRVKELHPGAYHYAADRHVLERLPQRDEAVAALLQSAMQASSAPEPPHVLIKLASRFGRMSWKYRCISYATTLKNVGVLYQTMYLVATAMGLGGCALGSGDDVAAEQALDLAMRSEIAVSEFMLGNLPSMKSMITKRFQELNPTWRAMVDPNWGCDNLMTIQ
jgi:SagB-type dehydrogenase family enzyme